MSIPILRRLKEKGTSNKAEADQLDKVDDPTAKKQATGDPSPQSYEASSKAGEALGKASSMMRKKKRPYTKASETLR